MLGLVGAALAHAAFPFVESIKGMQVIWFINGLCQALVWPPMARLVADMTHGKQTVSIVLALSFTSPVGMLSAYLFSAVMLEKKGWQYSFWFAAMVFYVYGAVAKSKDDPLLSDMKEDTGGGEGS